LKGPCWFWSRPVIPLITRCTDNLRHPVGVRFIFCTHLFWNHRIVRWPSEKGFASGIARARSTRWLFREHLSRRRGGSSNRDRGVRLPIQSHSPHDEEPTGIVQPLLALCFRRWVSSACRFDLCLRRLRVLFPPVGHLQHVPQSCTHLLHPRTLLPCVLFRFHARVPLSGSFSSSLLPHCSVQNNETHTICLLVLLYLTRLCYTYFQ
jgi:hypothetical protein